MPWLAAVVLMGCQWITGAKERSFLAAGSPSDGPQSCRPSDCGDGGVCLDGACRAACRSDADCDPGKRCLQTSLGAACVASSTAACGDGQGGDPCPDGTVCAGGQCRTTCSPVSLPCLIVGQACRNSVCVGTNPLHDPGAGDGGLGDGGNAGSGGASSGGTTAMSNGGIANGGHATNSGGTSTANGGHATNSGGTSTASGGTSTASGGTTANGGTSTGGAATMSSGGTSTASGGASSGGATTSTGGTSSGMCSDGRRDGSETDVDCGGPACPKCDDGRKCTQGSDCAVGACNNCNGQCMPCTAGQTCACGNAPISIDGACSVVQLRGGTVVESESSQDFCDPATPSIIPRPGDVTLIYVQSPPSQSVTMLSNVNPLPTWAARCTNTLQSRDDVQAQLNAAFGPSTTPDPDMFFLGVSTNCPVAAVYRLQW